MNTFNLQSAITVRDRSVLGVKPLTQEQSDTMFSGPDSQLNLESATFEEIQETLFDGVPYFDEPDQLLSAITTKSNRLSRTMAAFCRELDKGLGGKITSGEEYYSLIGEKLKGKTVSSAIVSKPRKVGAYAVVTALIPLSDGQSVSVLFYAPDDDPLKVNDTDTLIAFRFLLNKRDITHIVAPVKGKDLSLKQTVGNIAELALKNTDKFTANRAKQAEQNESLTTIQDETERLLEAAAAMADEVEVLKGQKSTVAKDIASTKAKLEKLNEANESLKADEPVNAPLNEAAIRKEMKGKLNEKQLERVENFTDFKLVSGKQKVTAIDGTTIDVNIENEADAFRVVDELDDEIYDVIEKQSERQLESLTNWKSQRAYFDKSGESAHLEIGKGLYGAGGVPDKIDGGYGNLYALLRHGDNAVTIYPICKKGQFKFAAYKDPKATKLLGEFDVHDELEMLCIFGLGLTDKAAGGQNQLSVEEFSALSKVEQKGKIGELLSLPNWYEYEMALFDSLAVVEQGSNYVVYKNALGQFSFGYKGHIARDYGYWEKDAGSAKKNGGFGSWSRADRTKAMKAIKQHAQVDEDRKADLKAQVTGRELEQIERLEKAGYKVMFEDGAGFIMTSPGGKVISDKASYAEFKEQLAYQIEQLSISSELESNASSGKPTGQYDKYGYLVEDTGLLPTKNSLNKLKPSDLNDGQYVIEYGDHSRIEVKKEGKDIEATWIVGGGLDVEVVKYSSVSKLKHYGAEKMGALGGGVSQNLQMNHYTQAELDKAAGAKKESAHKAAIDSYLNEQSKKLKKVYDTARIGDAESCIIERINGDAQTVTFYDREDDFRFQADKALLDKNGVFVEGIHQPYEVAAHGKTLVEELKPYLEGADTTGWVDDNGNPSRDFVDKVFDVLRSAGYSFDDALQQGRVLREQVALDNVDFDANFKVGESRSSAEAESNQPTGDSPLDNAEKASVKPALACIKEHVIKDGNRDIISSLNTIRDIDNGTVVGMTRALFVSSVAGKIKTLAKNGAQDKVNNVLTMIAEYNAIAAKPLISLRNGIWKLGEVLDVVSEDESVLKDADSHIADTEEVFGGKANHWYGLRVRPYDINAQPSGVVTYLDPQKASVKFPELSEREVRFGAVAYEQPLNQKDIDGYSLTDIANSGKPVGDAVEGFDQVEEWIESYLKAKYGAVSIPSSDVPELVESFEDVKSYLEKGQPIISVLLMTPIKQQVLDARNADMNAFEKIERDVNAADFDSIMSILGSLVEVDDKPQEPTNGSQSLSSSDETQEVEQSEESKQIGSLDGSSFEFGSEWQKEKQRDTKVIAKQISKHISQLKKSNALPKDVKVSVRSDYNSITMNVTGLPSSTPLFSDAYLAHTELDDGANFNAMDKHSSEVKTLLEYIKRFAGQFNYDNSDIDQDVSDKNFYSTVKVDLDLANERIPIELANYKQRKKALTPDAAEKPPVQPPAQEQEIVPKVNEELEKHLAEAKSIAQGNIPDLKVAMDTLQSAIEYLQANDLMVEHEAEIQTASDELTKALLSEASKVISD